MGIGDHRLPNLLITHFYMYVRTVFLKTVSDFDSLPHNWDTIPRSGIN